MSILSLMGWGWVGAALLMTLLWIVQWRRRNAGIVDVAWAFATGVLGVAFALGSEAGDPARKVLIAAMVGIWGIRLGVFLARRVGGESEDGRYRSLRETLGDRIQPFMFGFFQIQALWAVMFALPMWAAAQSPLEGLRWHDWFGLAIWAAALLGESVADAQLAQFRRNEQNRGKVCQQGLWRYSRHPNYFFEWVHWWAYVFIGIGSAWWWVTWVGVVVMLVFLTKVTGIPYTEKQALRSRGDAYRRYQATTSSFFPLPPKQETEGVNP